MARRSIRIGVTGLSAGIGLAIASAASAQTDGVCTFDFNPHYEQLTRLIDEPPQAAGQIDHKTLAGPPATSDTAAVLSSHETWYAPHAVGTACPLGTGTLSRFVGGGDTYDDVIPGGSLLGCPWTSRSRDGITPLRRYIRPSNGDRETWLFDSPPAANYVENATWWATGATPRLGYERFGSPLTRDQVLGSAYGRYFLDNGVLRIDYNHVWGNAIGRITHLASNRQVVLEPIGDMVQTVMRFGNGDADCRIPNPTQSGGVFCNVMLPNGSQQQNLQYTEHWAGSPVTRTLRTGTASNAPMSFLSEVRPLDFCHNGQEQAHTLHWRGGVDSISPLAWRGHFERTDTLGCMVNGSYQANIIKTRSRVRQTDGATIVAGTTANLLNTHWLREEALGDARCTSPTDPACLSIEMLDLDQPDAFSVTSVPLIYCASDAQGKFFYLNHTGTCGTVTAADSNSYNVPASGGDKAIVIYRRDHAFAYAVVKTRRKPDDDLAITLRCGASCDPANTGVIVQATREAMPYSDQWSEPHDSFLILGTYDEVRARINAMRSELSQAADIDCDT